MDVTDDPPVGSVDNDSPSDDLVRGLHLEAIGPRDVGYPPAESPVALRLITCEMRGSLATTHSTGNLGWDPLGPWIPAGSLAHLVSPQLAGSPGWVRPEWGRGEHGRKHVLDAVQAFADTEPTDAAESTGNMLRAHAPQRSAAWLQA